MSIQEAVKEVLRMLNSVEIKGEHNIAAMSRAFSLVKGIEDYLTQRTEEQHDSHDEQGEDHTH